MSKRKVRKDFDKSQPITVNVSGCSEDVKKRVQQAFFDIGVKWVFSGETYGLLKESFYTSVTSDDDVTSSLMWVDRENLSSIVDPITPKEFFAMVYEEESQGHPHAELMMAYAEDAMTNEKPWELYQIKTVQNIWKDIGCQFIFDSKHTYRRKPKTHLVHGVEIPDLRIKPEIGGTYYLANPISREYFDTVKNYLEFSIETTLIERGLVYEHTEEGKQAAILHAKIMLGIADK